MGRLKTGTPVRVLGRSIDTASLAEQGPDAGDYRFSFRKDIPKLPVFSQLQLEQRPCFMTYSTAATAEIVRQNLARSAMYSGRISGTGTRYCPSFEDKIVRFSERERHHINLEPEGNSTDEYYLNGFSTSLPVEIQWEMVHSLPGLENAHITRYAYAIEYDFVLPHQLDISLALRAWPIFSGRPDPWKPAAMIEAAAQGWWPASMSHDWPATWVRHCGLDGNKLYRRDDR
jgi:tRNA uridine 5-carboxymethylaminomethyl modification enzyme